jgi:phosphatidylserine/phosphatidylglycerophosphate/cardiolipin synthase-like enzyme
MSMQPHLKLKAYRGDFKTLLAFDLPEPQALGLAGFTIQCCPPGGTPYYLYNALQFEDPGQHAQDSSEPANSSINAPIHKFRWLHVPGSAHQGLAPAAGRYRYVVTPRYFDHDKLLALDPGLSASIDVDVGPFEKQGLRVGLTRGYVQSQAFAHHFGAGAVLQPKDHTLLFDTSQVGGKSPAGTDWTYEDAYAWLGHTARQRIFEFLDEVEDDPALFLEVFAYDLNEPDVCRRLLALAALGRLRVILDDAGLHHKPDRSTPEDQFEDAFRKMSRAPSSIMRGSFGRYSHDKVFIAATRDGAVRVLTGSTNFSVTGLYVNSNHVVIYDNPEVAGQYHRLFAEVWKDEAARGKFVQTAFSTTPYRAPASVPSTTITFAPHVQKDVDAILGGICQRVQAEASQPGGSVFFAMMELDHGNSPVWDELRGLHAQPGVMSYGISDSTATISLYEPGKQGGLVVTGHPGRTVLPAPFDQVPGIAGHQIHHKFVVCGFNRPDAVVYCGSSNLAVGGELDNGDNLLEIRDPDVATVFAIEALQLVDHFQFLDRMGQRGADMKKIPAVKDAAAKAQHWYLPTSDGWKDAYYEHGNLRARDRELFAGGAPVDGQ